MNNTLSVTPMSAQTILVIGCGRMGGAIINGWLKNKIAPDNIHIVDPNSEALSEFKLRGVNIYQSKDDLPQAIKFDCLLIALKPQLFEQVLPSYKKLICSNILIISIAAGMKCQSIEKLTCEGQAVIRIMPNTPALINEGVIVAVPNSHTTQDQLKLCESLFSSLGSFDWIQDEEKMHAVTAISGSGPAYFFHFIESMIEAAKSAGLDDELAKKLAIGTIIGSAKLVESDIRDISELRKEVTSPKGTTEAALHILMQDNRLINLIEEAATAAASRSIELS